MQWDEQCLDLLYVAPLTNNTSPRDICRCPLNGSEPEAWTTDGTDTLLSFGQLTLKDADTDSSIFHADDENDGLWRLSVTALPVTVVVTVRSQAPPCADILEATLFERAAGTSHHTSLFTVTQVPSPAPTPKPTPAPTSVAAVTLTDASTDGEGSPSPPRTPELTAQTPPLPFEPFRRATPAHVLARADGTYRLTATVHSEGDHDLLVRLAYRRWVPRQACRAEGCREVYDVPDATNSTKPFPFITKRLHVALVRDAVAEVVGSSPRLGFEKDGDDEKEELKAACPSIDRLMARGGSWVLDPGVMLGYNASADPAHIAQPSDRSTGWHATWQPPDCRLQLYDPAELTRAFEGKHFLVIGDSITHMLMAIMMELIVGKDQFRYPTNGPEFCGHNNRVYDSGDMLWPVRFSFLWAGAAYYCDSDKGLPHLLDNNKESGGDGLARFKRGLGKDVDYVVMNAGAHDIAGAVPLEEYDRLLPSIFDMVLNASASVRARPSRLLWRSTTAHVYRVGDWNAGIHWMNWMAEGHARRRGFAVLDSHQIWTADTELRRANGPRLPNQAYCGDGMHGRADRNVGTEDAPRWTTFYCDKVYAEAAIAVHHFMQLASEA